VRAFGAFSATALRYRHYSELYATYHDSLRRVARGGQWGQLPPPPIPKVFRSIKLLICKPKKIFSVNHRKCLLLHNLVEPDQSTVVHQLSMINQTLCTKGGNGRIF